MRAKRDSPPRTKADACRPAPPARAVATPGVSWRSWRNEDGARSAIRSRSQAEALVPRVENEAGGGHDQDVLAGSQACHLIAPFRARDQRAWAGRADQGEGEGRHRPAIGRPYRTGENSR